MVSGPVSFRFLGHLLTPGVKRCVRTLVHKDKEKEEG